MTAKGDAWLRLGIVNDKYRKGYDAIDWGKKDSLRYWICCDHETGRTLTEIGVVLGLYDNEVRQYRNCEITPEIFVKMNPLWGRIIWGIEGRETGERDVVQ